MDAIKLECTGIPHCTGTSFHYNDYFMRFDLFQRNVTDARIVIISTHIITPLPHPEPVFKVLDHGEEIGIAIDVCRQILLLICLRKPKNCLCPQ